MTVSGRHLAVLKGSALLSLPALFSLQISCHTAQSNQVAQLSSPFLASVMNDSSQEEVSIRDIRILPNLNASYLPMMPDGSVLLMDNVWCVSSSIMLILHSLSPHHVTLSVVWLVLQLTVQLNSCILFCFCALICVHVLLPVSLHSHQSGEVGMGSFCRVDSLAGRLPGMLSALEEHDFLFQLHLNDIPQDDSNEVYELFSKTNLLFCF